MDVGHILPNSPVVFCLAPSSWLCSVFILPMLQFVVACIPIYCLCCSLLWRAQQALSLVVHFATVLTLVALCHSPHTSCRSTTILVRHLYSPYQSSMSDDDTPALISNDQFTRLMEAIQASQDRVDHKLCEFRAEVRQGQEEAAIKALKRVRHEKPYEFRRKGNEEQATFNSRVDEAMTETLTELTDAGTSPALERAQTALTKGRRLIDERQKLIKIADRSEYGWGVVAEYTADELADDSEDEKRIEKAERAAERRAVKRKRKRAELAQPKAIKARFNAGQTSPALATHAGPSPGLPARRVAVAPVATRTVGPCFACGEMGHLRASCPKTSAEGRKRYPFPSRCAMNAAAAGEVPNCLIDKGVDGVSTDRDVVVTDHCLDMELGDVACLWEAETTEPASTGPVKGRLKERLKFWKEEIQAPTFVLDTIEAGYVLPLKTNPTPFSRQNQASALGNAEFVEESVAGLLTSGCIKEVDSIPYICSPLSVVESSGGKKRLVINLRHLNRFLWKQKFKYEDLRVAMLLFEKGDYLFSFDLKSGYHHVDITEAHWKYLGFAWGGGNTLCLLYSHLVCPRHATYSPSSSVPWSAIGVLRDLE